MSENRVHVNCLGCQNSWLIQPERPIWKGTPEQLAEFEGHRGRKWNCCKCGENIYSNGVYANVNIKRKLS